MTATRRLLMVLGGAWHDFDGFAQATVPMLADEGFAVETTHDHTRLVELDKAGFDLVVIYTSLGNADDGKRKGPDFAPQQVEALARWVAAGRGLLAVHSASVAAPSSIRYRALIGGAFEGHPEPFTFTVYPAHTRDPLTEGIGSFEVFDEFYLQTCAPDIAVHLASIYKNEWHPVAWTRREGAGRVAYFGLGHGPKAWNLPQYRTILTRMARWCCQGPTGQPPR